MYKVWNSVFVLHELRTSS